MTQLSLVGKTALVTGASSGIGHATALALAVAGIRVVLVGRSRERLDAAAAQAGAGSHALAADLTHPEQVEQVFARAQADFGRQRSPSSAARA